MVVGYMRWVLLLAPFCRWENGGSERFSLLLKCFNPGSEPLYCAISMTQMPPQLNMPTFVPEFRGGRKLLRLEGEKKLAK